MQALNIATAVAQLRPQAAPLPLTGIPTLVAAPPPLPDQIDLTPEQTEYGLRLARLRKWGVLKREFSAWQQLHCDLQHDEATNSWVYVLRERFADLEPPFCPVQETDVPLTPAETDQALFDTQQRVWGELNTRYVRALREQEDAYRKQTVPTPATGLQIAEAAWRRGTFLLSQMTPPRAFSLTPDTEPVFNLLVWYFAGREDKFVELATQLGIEHPSLHKGIALLGPKGTGKTMLLRAFQQNQARPYGMVTAKKVELSFRAGDEGRTQQDVFCGKGGRALCIDDVCTEETKVKDYGNQENPMARVLLERYDRYQQGLLPRWATHLSSNNPLYRTQNTPRDMASWEELYGDRAVDRLHELCNIIPVLGESRRQ
ncbi:hypothetical protein [Hymenobacter sediminicola]|uniref:Uncharacterized protein n=1 Tax=Hymenobacter sediminicola TaxID=2761579 RepID=A0A7G7W2Y3_9BACT|nr:hypothetical protein [Hymenobacter sediminicola]QNH60726.1 hypothetical protein H4317_11035 [Hymenobacter sediminicola]